MYTTVIPNRFFPTIASRDYLTDDEFGDIYRYLDSDELTCNAGKDRTIVLKAERYLIDDDGLLYKMDIPRQKKLARLKPIIKKNFASRFDIGTIC